MKANKYYIKLAYVHASGEPLYCVMRKAWPCDKCLNQEPLTFVNAMRATSLLMKYETQG